MSDEKNPYESPKDADDGMPARVYDALKLALLPLVAIAVGLLAGYGNRIIPSVFEAILTKYK